MKPVLLALALLFGLVGLVIWGIGSIDPAPRDKWITTTGIVSKAGVTSSQKNGRVWSLELVNDPDRFSLTHLEKMPDLEPWLIGQVKPGTELSIQTVPRQQAKAIGASNLPIPVLVLQVGDRVVYDRDDYTGGASRMILFVSRAMAVLAWLVSAGLLWLLFRNRQLSKS